MQPWQTSSSTDLHFSSSLHIYQYGMYSSNTFWEWNQSINFSFRTLASIPYICPAVRSVRSFGLWFCTSSFQSSPSPTYVMLGFSPLTPTSCRASTWFCSLPPLESSLEESPPKLLSLTWQNPTFLPSQTWLCPLLSVCFWSSFLDYFICKWQ